MLVPVSWLKEYVDITLPVDQLAEKITLAGLEVAGIEQVGEWWDAEKIVVGQIVAVKSHPNADRLVLADVDEGNSEPETIVTGAPNVMQYKDAEDLPVLKVAFAKAGATVINAYSDQRPRPKMTIKPAKIRGISSKGMVCSERELGLSDEHEGILYLPEDGPVGTSLKEYMGDDVIDIDLTPDMARCLCQSGVAREVAAITGAALHIPADECQTSGDDTAADYVAVEINNPELCNRYTGMMIKDVEIKESPQWMQDRLRKAGMRPLNNVIDITNYVMLEFGQPLHAFDYDVLAERAKKSGAPKTTIIVRTADSNEKFTTLDDVERELDESILMITDTAGSVAVAGIMGGENSEVSENTRNILLESATFDGINNRRSAQKLKLPSEASHRFTRGIPAKLNDIAARRAAELMRLYAGGRIVPGIVDTYPVPQEQRIVYLTESEVQRQLGMDVPLETIRESLQRLKFEVETLSSLPDERSNPGDAVFGLHITPSEPILRCTVPWYRLDVKFPADLTEEVARMIGYDQIEMTLMRDTLPPQKQNEILDAEDNIRDVLVGCGLQETINYTFTTPEHHNELRLDQSEATTLEDRYITIANPLSSNRRVLRRSMIVSALENLAYNARFTDRMAVFEIGKVYLPEKGDGVRPLEERQLSILLSGPRRLTSFHGDPFSEETFDFFDLKGIVETLLTRLGFSAQEVNFVAKTNHSPFGSRCAEIHINGEMQGVMGELHPEIRKRLDLPEHRVCVAELCYRALIKPHWRIERMEKISSYPAITEDLAFVLREDVTARQIQNVIYQAGGSLLVHVELFDVFRGKTIPAGHKSLAYRLTYQSLETTLTDDEVATIRDRIIKAVADSVGGTLRE